MFGVRPMRQSLFTIFRQVTATRGLVNVSTKYRPIRLNGFIDNTIWNRTLKNKRFYSVISEECRAKKYDYENVKSLVSNPSSDVLLVDVREPIEFQLGHIPGAINIPFKSNPGALSLSEEDFEDNFGFEKPPADKELVFYCLGGVRSTAAEDLAKTFGYKNRGNYIGSYEDWLAHENKRAQEKSS